MFNPFGGSYAEKFVQAIAPIASPSGIDLKVSPTRNAAEIDQRSLPFRASQEAVSLSVQMASPPQIVDS
jgi:hypothetical protein